MDAKHAHDELATYFAAIERDPGHAAGYQHGPRGAARAPAPHRREACACGGEHSFAPTDDSDIEAVFAEAAYAAPDESDPDFSELNGHAGNGHTYIWREPVAAGIPRVFERRLEGDAAVAGGSSRSASHPLRRPRSVGSMAVWETGHEMGGDVVASPRRRLTQCRRALDAAAPGVSIRLVWLAVLVGMILWALGML